MELISKFDQIRTLLQVATFCTYKLTEFQIVTANFNFFIAVNLKENFTSSWRQILIKFTRHCV